MKNLNFIFSVRIVFLLFMLGWSLHGSASNQKRMETNHVYIHNPPVWLAEKRVNKITEKVQDFLEWRIRRINVYWYSDADKFKKIHGFGSWARAIARKKDQTIHIGPKVNTKNFDGIFGHELAHIVVFQKYKRAIPPWLDEGLANYAAKHGTVDYKYLASKPRVDVTKLTHPVGKRVEPRYHYNASTALMEMFADKCSISDLLQLSVGKKLEIYLKTYCEIADLNEAFAAYVQDRAKGKKKKKYWWEK